MRKVLVATFLALSFCLPAYAQRGSNQTVVSTNTTPTGSCSGNLIQIKRASPLEVYACIGATWTLLDTQGNAATATALFANPSDCSANQFANTIAANGNLTCAAIADADVPNTITIDLSATATALAANPSDCGANEFATGIAASGNLTCATASGTGDVTDVGDCATGACFNGTQGTTLTFNNAGGDGIVGYDGTDFDFDKPVVGTSFEADASATSGGSLDLYEDTDNGANKFTLTVGASALASDATCTIGTDGKIPHSCLPTRTSEECFTLFDAGGLVDTNDIPSVWQAPAAVTITAVSCEADAATDITINVAKDDACDTAAISVTYVESGNLQCGTTMTAGTIDAANDNFADGDCLDLATIAETSSTRVTVCIEFTYD